MRKKHWNVGVNLKKGTKIMEKENSRLFVPKAYLTAGFRRIYHLVLSFTKQDVWFSNTAANSLNK